MGYIRPTLAQLAQQTENDFYTHFGGTSRPVRFSIIKIISLVFAGGLHLLYGFIAFIMVQIIPDSSTGKYLERWAFVFGLQKKKSSKAEGVVNFTGNNGAKIQAFTQIQTSDNFIFQTLFDVEIKEGKASVKIQALKPSSFGNIKGGAILNLVSPISNVQSNCVLDDLGTFNGTDIESDSSLRSRLLDRIRNAPCAGNKNDYETWCKQVAGVTRALCYPLYQGDGNVGLTFVRDNDVNIIPNETQLQEMKQYLSAIMPCTAKLYVFAPNATHIDFRIKSSDISDDSKKQITDQLKFLFFNIANPSQTIYISDILESLASMKTLSRFSLLSPTQDIVLGDKSVGVVGAVTLEGF